MDPAGRRRPARGEPDGQGRAAGKDLDHERLKALRHDYDQAVAVGISANLSRRWHKGNHPGLVLAQRLQRKADQVWLFTTRFDVPATMPPQNSATAALAA